MNLSKTKDNRFYSHNTMQGTVSLTFCDSGENHAGMKMLGERVEPGEGFAVEDLQRAKANFEALGCECEMVDFASMLREIAGETHQLNIPDGGAGTVLIIRGGAKVFGDVEEMKKEMGGFEWDKKYWCARRKKVLNKHARANVCFDVQACDADYEQGQGTIVSWDAVPEVAKIRSGLKFMLGRKGQDLVCEGNQYFSEKCGIGFHGDAERRKVVAVRLGNAMRMQWCWYYKHSAVGRKCEVLLEDGDMYIMEEKAVGTDWRRSCIFTLRHAAGAEKYLKEKRKEGSDEVAKEKLLELFANEQTEE